MQTGRRRGRWLPTPAHRTKTLTHKMAESRRGVYYVGAEEFDACLEWRQEVMMERCERTGDEGRVRKCCLAAATACLCLQSHYNAEALLCARELLCYSHGCVCACHTRALHNNRLLSYGVGRGAGALYRWIHWCPLTGSTVRSETRLEARRQGQIIRKPVK